MTTARRGLHLLGADADAKDKASTASKTDYSSYLKAGGDAAGSIIKSIEEGLRPSAPPHPTPPPPEKSNTAWYVGGAVVIAVLVAWLVKR